MKLFFAFVFSLLSMAVQARENITVVYSWTAADTAANFHRALAEEANRLQNRYNFIFDTKPGAGGSIAANHVLNNSNTVLATASAFFIRPNFFPAESHDISRFRVLFPQCAAPAAITSKRYRAWSEVPRDRPITIGMSGMGTTTHLIAHQLTSQYPNLTIVPFRSTTEAILSVLSDSTDFAVNFLGDSAQYVEQRRLQVLGITGSQPVAGYPTLSSQGFTKNLDFMTVPAQILIPNSFPEVKAREIRDIFRAAGTKTSVLDSYRADFCQSNNQMPDSDMAAWYSQQTADWRKLTQGVSLK